MGIQSMVLTRVLNPGTLGRVYDNEFITPAKEDALTLPEVLKTVEGEIWSELDKGDGKFTEREPMVSSLRRNLQREYVERLIDLSMPNTWGQVSHKPIGTLALMHLRNLSVRIGKAVEARSGDMDAYTKAHLTEAKLRIDKAVDAGYVLNPAGLGGGLPYYFFYGQTNGPAGSR